jgi:hypothetical protein
MRLQILIFISLAAALSYSQEDNYTLADSLEFSNPATSGTARLLKLNNRKIDTVDAAFGIQYLGGTTVICRKVALDRKSWDGNSYTGYFSDYVVYEGGKRTLLKNILPDFDDWLSSPSVIQDCILYWGIKREKNSRYLTVYAMRYESTRRRTDSILLFSEKMKGDNPGFFYRPAEDFGGFRFQYEERSWLVEKSFSRKEREK